MARVSWQYTLECGCTVLTVIDGIAQVDMFDGAKGLNVKCLTHGWSVEVKGSNVLD